MNWLAIILTVAIVYGMAKDFSKFKETITFSLRIWRLTRIHTVLISIAALAAILIAVVTLDSLFPFMSKISWVYWISGESYNVGIAAPAHIGIDEENVFYKMGYGLLLIGMFILLPHWAFFEEKMFRQGRNKWKQVPLTSLVFGLIHMVVGVPLTAGLALAIPGAIFHAYYIFSYKRFIKNPRVEKSIDGMTMEAENIAEAVATLKATSLHTIYNSFIISILFLITVL